MFDSDNFSMTRRCFLTATGLAAGIPAAAGARQSFSTNRNMPKAAILRDGVVTTYLLEFSTGQEVMEGLLAFARAHHIESGYITGIGALSHAVIGYFDPQTNTYLRNVEQGQAELLSLTGNIAVVKNEPFFHVHVALGLRNGAARGGHLFEATIRPTVELILTTYIAPIRRKIDPDTGLPLLNI